MGEMLKELERLLHPKGQLTELGFCALIGEDTISIMKGSAKIGTWSETKPHLEFKTAIGVSQARLQADSAIDAARQTIDFVQSLNR
jgi:hypothetical protein